MRCTSLLVGLALCLGAFLFTQNYAIVKDRVWVGMSGEARVNGLLAARMLLTRMGARVQESSDLARLDKFPLGGTIFLAADRSELDPPTATRLLAWVQDGGHLVVAVERPYGARSAAGNARCLGATGRASQLGLQGRRCQRFPTGLACV